MRFTRPAGGTFEIPDEWWRFADMNTFLLGGSRCFPVDPARVSDLVPIADIEPPDRDAGVAPFKKAKMVPILMAFVSSNELPPIKACRLRAAAPYKYRLYDGYHRFYASVAVGYPMVPISDVGDCQ